MMIPGLIISITYANSAFLDSMLWKLMTKKRILDSTRAVGGVSEDRGASEECRLKAAEE